MTQNALRFFDKDGNPLNNSTSNADKEFVSGMLPAQQVAKPTNVSIFEPVSQHAHLNQHRAGFAIPSTRPAVGTVYTTQSHAVTPAVVPFYPPDLEKTLPKWDSDKADPEQNWVITHIPESHKNKDPKTILADPSIGVVFFTPKVFLELQYAVNRLADKTGECAMFVLLRQLSSNEELQNRKPHYLAYDWFMPKQTASAGEVKLDVADCTKYFEHLLEKYPEEFPDRGTLHRNLMHAHSHHRMNLCAWSGTDNTQQTTRDELAFYGLYRLFFLFTIGHGLKCTMVTYVPHLSKTDYAIGLCYSEPEYVVSLTKARKKELDEQMDALVSKSYSVGTTYTPYWQHHTTYPSARTTPANTAVGASAAAKPAASQRETPTRSETYGRASLYDDEMDEFNNYMGRYGYGYYMEMDDTGPEVTKTGSVIQPTVKKQEDADIFELLPNTQRSTFERKLLRACEMLTAELKEFAMGWTSPVGDIRIPESYVDKVAASIDSHRNFDDLYPIAGSHIYTQLDQAFAEVVVQQLVDLQLAALGDTEEIEVDDDGNEFIFRDVDAPSPETVEFNDINWDELINDAFEEADSILYNITRAIAEMVALASFNKEMSDALLTQLYNESYLNCDYSKEDVDVFLNALKGEGTIYSSIQEYWT